MSKGLKVCVVTKVKMIFLNLKDGTAHSFGDPFRTSCLGTSLEYGRVHEQLQLFGCKTYIDNKKP